MGQQTLVISAVPPTLNTLYSGMHWGARSHLVRDWHEQVLVECRVQGIRPVQRANLTFVCRFPGRRLDCSNILVKVLEDGLVRAGILPDDSPTYVPQITIRSERGRRRETIITIDDTAI